MLSLSIALLMMALYFQFEVKSIVIALMPLVFFCDKRRSFKHLTAYFLIAVITVHLSSTALDEITLSTSFEKSDIHHITGYVVSDGTLSSFNRQRITLEVRECNIKNGSVAAAKGVVSVTLPRKKMFLTGDLISADGHFNEYGFQAKSAFLKRRSAFNRSRALLLNDLARRLHSGDEGADNLSIMLLLGFSDVENSELSLLARSSGTSFLLALSGMHIGLLSHIISSFFRLFGSKREAKAIALLLLTFYIALVGPKPSVVRAYILSLCFLLFPSNKGEENLLFTLILQLLIFPASVITLSAAFSYIALAGIMGLSSLIRKALDEVILLPIYFTSSFSASLSALLFSVPFTYMVFGSYQLSSLLSTIVLSPLIYLYMLLSIVSLFLPLPSSLRSILYKAIKRIMKIGSIEMQTTMTPYFIMALSVLCLLLLSYILNRRRRYVES